jgi:hypothetical protein
MIFTAILSNRSLHYRSNNPCRSYFCINQGMSKAFSEKFEKTAENISRATKHKIGLDVVL